MSPLEMHVLTRSQAAVTSRRGLAMATVTTTTTMRAVTGITEIAADLLTTTTIAVIVAVMTALTRQVEMTVLIAFPVRVNTPTIKVTVIATTEIITPVATGMVAIVAVRPTTTTSATTVRV